jgi:hypothetical protein
VGTRFDFPLVYLIEIAGTSLIFELETPLWGDLVRKSPTSIPIKPLRSASDPRFIRKPSSHIVFRASLANDITGLEIAEWLKTAPPASVTAINIEAIVQKARRIQSVAESDIFPAGSIFNKLSKSAQSDIIRSIQNLNTVMANSASNAHNSVLREDDDLIGMAFGSIQGAVSAVCDAVETPILLDLNPKDMDMALEDENAIVVGAAESVSLKQSMSRKTAIPDGLEIPRENIKLEDSASRFRSGQIENKTVLVELFAYAPQVETKEPYPESVEQIQRMTARLCHPKHTSFHILPCIGYIHNRFRCEFGLVFEVPRPLNPGQAPCMLQDLYNLYKELPFGDRIRIAYHLAVALENFHRVGWVHKEFRSSNVYFLPSAEPLIASLDRTTNIEVSNGHVSISDPWIFGFEYARAEDAGTRFDEDYNTSNNLYRHQDRWGRPTAKSTRAHDVYSLVSFSSSRGTISQHFVLNYQQGIVLFEVACWKSIQEIIKFSNYQHIQYKFLREVIEKTCRTRLPFQVGNIFTNVIKACFDFENVARDLDEYTAHKHFQQNIVGKLKQMVENV